MSTRGRKPKPTKTKEIQGNPGHRPLNRAEPKPQSAVKKPHGLGKGAAKFWRDHAPELKRLEILTGVDSAAFQLMAEHYAVAIQAAAELHEEGLTIEGRDGAKKNPLAQVFKDNSMAFKAYATEFGMTPSARTRLQMPADAEQLTLADELFALVGGVVVAEADD